MPVMEEQTQKRSQRVVNNRSISVKLWTSCEPASVNNTNNIDGSLADDRFIEALLCNCYYCNLYGPAFAAQPGPARYTSGPARPGPWPTFFYLGPARPGPARGPPGPCRSLVRGLESLNSITKQTFITFAIEGGAIVNLAPTMGRFLPLSFEQNKLVKLSNKTSSAIYRMQLTRI